MKDEISEFGKGFIYNLILFASHFERNFAPKGEEDNYIWVSCWFNGASDHLYEFEIPPKFEKLELGTKAKELKDFVLSIGHGERMNDKTVSRKDIQNVISLTKDIGFLIDKELGFNPVKGQWK